MTLEERFWPKVNKAGPVVRAELGPCWVWTASKYVNGYGMLRRGGRGEGVEGAHRVAFMLEHGRLPALAMHICDNPSCVKATTDASPAHVIEGSAKANTRDMIMKGRAGVQVLPRSACPHGHEYTADNTIIDIYSGAKRCRICRTAQQRLADARYREKVRRNELP